MSGKLIQSHSVNSVNYDNDDDSNNDENTKINNKGDNGNDNIKSFL